jgi:hypothetical protein
MLIKPMSLFLTLPVLIGLNLDLSRGEKPRFSPGQLIITIALCFIPAGLYYGYWAVFGNFVRDQMHMRFVPSLLGTSFFWGGLLRQIRRVFTLPLWLISLLGIVLTPLRTGRLLLACLWIGWCAFAVAFTYHMPTHDYYHWPYIAAVALGVGAVVSRLELMVAAWVPTRVFTGLAVATGIVIGVLGTREAWPRLEVPGAAAWLERYREIGQICDHDTRVLFLDPEYGYPLMYHAEVAGDTWPGQDDLAAEALGGGETISADERFDRDYAGLKPNYFVVTDLDSLEGQPDLQRLLASRASLVRQTPKYHVYKFNAQN